ncbi:MAG: hypothetical protein RL417_790, partial [Pseudomonadota bacterium]
GAIDRLRSRCIEAGREVGWRADDSEELFRAVTSAIYVGTGTERRTILEMRGSGAAVDCAALREGVAGLRNFVEGAKLEPFGLRYSTVELLMKIELGQIRSHDNACGPIALFYLIQSQKGEERLHDAKSQQQLYETLYRAIAPGRFGSAPEKLPEAVRVATGGELELHEHVAGSSAEVQRCLDGELAAKRACVVKYGSSLFNQHYDCIRSVEEVGGVKFYSTTSGYLIPEGRLLDLMSQPPYRNHVWTVTPAQKAALPTIDLDSIRNDLAKRG